MKISFYDYCYYFEKRNKWLSVGTGAAEANTFPGGSLFSFLGDAAPDVQGVGARDLWRYWSGRCLFCFLEQKGLRQPSSDQKKGKPASTPSSTLGFSKRKNEGKLRPSSSVHALGDWREFWAGKSLRHVLRSYNSRRYTISRLTRSRVVKIHSKLM